MNNPCITRAEILSQTEAWTQALQVAGSLVLPNAVDFHEVLFIGCGSAYYLSLSAAAVYQLLTGRIARAVPSGELLLDPMSLIPADGSPRLLVAISRSGTTSETIRAVQQFKNAGLGKVVVITNNRTSLSQLADHLLLIQKGAEESVVQTRAFTSMYIAAVALCTRMAQRPDLLDAMSALPDVGRRLMDSFEPAMQQLGTDLGLDRFYFLGSGLRYGLACEVSLKMKEMTLTHSEPFHFLEFRHGPMSMVGSGSVVVGLLSEQNRIHESAVLNEMKALGARLLTLAETGAEIPFESGVPESVRAVLYLPCLQLMALHRSLAKGLNPDRPRNLTAAVHLDL